MLVNNRTHIISVFLAAATVSCASLAETPKFLSRKPKQNYQDMVLADCLYEAYAEKNEVIAKDLGRSFQELDAKAKANFEPGRDRMKMLVKKYLNKDYTDPSSPPGVKWDFLKCLDLYHSIELRNHINQNSCNTDC